MTAVKTTLTPVTACAGRKMSDSAMLKAHNELSQAAYAIVMQGVEALEKEQQNAACPYPKASMSAQLWGAGYFMGVAEAAGAAAARNLEEKNPYQGGGTKNGVVIGPFAGLALQRAYLAVFWQDGHDLQIAETAALYSNAEEVQP